ncbi:hypothetical protein [Bradyrhizobium sp.]|uniref:hypothetical protein n=1 Tax=Bradyrhizobium sp. TaxID=376 RepID=UPI001D88E72C|nr:hypothetical protein [Bradyrhizobium sp.]MBI5319510.1 hypothetical protein [Bradyrhizobium sp.]
MTFNYRISRQIAACVVAATLVAVTAAVAMGLTYPDPVSSGALGPDWQCTRLAFVFTSCTRVVRLKTASAEEGKAPSCRRPAAWRNVLGLLR